MLSRDLSRRRAEDGAEIMGSQSQSNGPTQQILPRPNRAVATPAILVWVQWMRGNNGEKWE